MYYRSTIPYLKPLGLDLFPNSEYNWNNLGKHSIIKLINILQQVI